MLGRRRSLGWWLLLGVLKLACGNQDDNSTMTDARESDEGTTKPDAAGDDSFSASMETQDSRAEDAGTSQHTSDLGAALQRYARIGCNYYFQCSPDVAMLYADEETCVALLSSLIGEGAAAFSANTSIKTLLSKECLDSLEAIECPVTSGRRLYYLDAVQHITTQVLHCFDLVPVACQTAEHCTSGLTCGTDGEVCGTCERDSSECSSSFDCPVGHGCVDDVCVKRVSVGSACTVDDECLSWRCRLNTCVEEPAIGDSCESASDCTLTTWCDPDGKCAAPGGAGAACEEDSLNTCKLGTGCVSGACRAAALENARAGEPCLFDHSCVAGNECKESICAPTEGECSADSHCADGQYCDDGTCQPRLADGNACTSDRQCQSASCSDDDLCVDSNPCD